MAQRMTLLYGLNSPEFFDRALFGNFIDLLRARGVIRADGNGKLEFDEVLTACGAATPSSCCQRADPPQHPAGHARLKHLAAAPRRVID